MNFKEELLAIKEDNERLIETGMVFNVRLSLTNFSKNAETSTARNCLVLADTLIVLKEGAEVLTRAVTRTYGEISYFLDDEPEDKNAVIENGDHEESKRAAKPNKKARSENKK